jgi:hypothetical protein
VIDLREEKETAPELMRVTCESASNETENLPLFDKQNRPRHWTFLGIVIDARRDSAKTKRSMSVNCESCLKENNKNDLWVERHEKRRI